MKKLIAIAILTCATAHADNWEPSLDEPQSGDRVVLNDKTYVLLSENDFAALTNKMYVLISMAHRQWNEQHKTESGRRAWHGAKMYTDISTNEVGKIVKVTTYSDGYRHTEEGEVKTNHVKSMNAKRNVATRPIRATDIPKRLREARKAVNVNREVE